MFSFVPLIFNASLSFVQSSIALDFKLAFGIKLW